MAKNNDYWIKNDNWLPVAENHFKSITDNPEKFGLTAQRITELCEEFGATGGSDGPARDSVMREAAQHGWVRIRTFDNGETRVIVQGYHIDRQISSIRDVVDQLRSYDVITETATMVISDYATGDSRTFRVGATGIPEHIDGDLELS